MARLVSPGLNPAAGEQHTSPYRLVVRTKQSTRQSPHNRVICRDPTPRPKHGLVQGVYTPLPLLRVKRGLAASVMWSAKHRWLINMARCCAATRTTWALSSMGDNYVILKWEIESCKGILRFYIHAHHSLWTIFRGTCSWHNIKWLLFLSIVVLLHIWLSIDILFSSILGLHKNNRLCFLLRHTNWLLLRPWNTDHISSSRTLAG